MKFISVHEQDGQWLARLDEHPGDDCPGMQLFDETSLYKHIDNLHEHQKGLEAMRTAQGVMPSKPCSHCKHYVADASTDGWCYRYPPILTDNCWSHPTVDWDNSCGEWSEVDAPEPPTVKSPP